MRMEGTLHAPSFGSGFSRAVLEFLDKAVGAIVQFTTSTTTYIILTTLH